MLSVIVVSYNRVGPLRATLRELSDQGWFARGEVIVVDNASTDGSGAMVRAEFPQAVLIETGANLGIEAYNRGAAVARGDTLLILDDDARPDGPGLLGALDLLAREPRVGGVALRPEHPATHASEWPFAREAMGQFPVMGCGNVVRAQAWREAGGYEAAMFLYRNDVDLAMKLLSLGWDVRYDPAWVVWHDSPTQARKGPRWLELATRNWVWLCRRHGRGGSAWRALAAGLARALGYAGFSPSRVWRVVVGACSGVAKAPPPLPQACRRDGAALRRYLTLRRVP